MRGREAITNMRSVAALLLIASAVPAMAFSRPGGRQRRAAAQAVAGAYSTAGGGGFGYGGGAGGGAGGGGAGAGAGGFVFPDANAFGPTSFHSALRNYLDQMEAMFAQQQEQAHSAGAGGVGGLGDVGGGAGSGLGGGAGGAQASLALGERGGFAQAQLFPDAGLNSRIAADLSPPAGGPIGVFSSSSSSSHTDESGKTHTFKQATVGVNDNGNVRVFSVKDP